MKIYFYFLLDNIYTFVYLYRDSSCECQTSGIEMKVRQLGNNFNFGRFHFYFFNML